MHDGRVKTQAKLLSTGFQSKTNLCWVKFSSILTKITLLRKCQITKHRKQSFCSEEL